MSQERKISVLRNLLERVQKRAAVPRVAPLVGPPTATPSPAVSAPVASAAPMGISAPPATPSATSPRPGSSTLPLNFGSRGEPSDARRPTASSPDQDADEGPPSRPRLREVPEEDISAEEREIDEDEPPVKTPPPESGRQHVTPGPAASVSEPDDDISITVTMEESEEPPPISSTPYELARIPTGAVGHPELSEVSGPQPRLALVSEPEIELHGMTPLSAIVEPIAPAKPPPPPPPIARPAASSSLRAQDVDLAVAVPSPSVPPVTRPEPAAGFARTAPSASGDTKPSVSAAAPAEPAASAPPVRLMAQPASDPSGKPLPPVEVWASTHTPAQLRGQVASFVGHNANFEPKTFVELVRASVALGEDKS